MAYESALASEVRDTFLSFFRDRSHEVVPSASLIPQNDPTLMFINAGMVQFKDVFTGKDTRESKRAASSQKCIRISGKHNDLENVGVTARHQTFFEMLGNFSFGDYFKEDAIAYAWELLTKVYDIPSERMVITVFKGEAGFAADDEAADIWRKVTGFGDDRILRLGMADNFWSMGDTGPCGPCSEIHYFHGPDVDVSRFGEEPHMDGSGWTEIWNLVFMQYDRSEKGAEPTALPAPSIDTGMGLERVASVIQGVKSNYDTDLLRGLVELAAQISKKDYRGTTADDDVSMRVIADHARTTAFLIAEGIMPDKQRREYVLRRVMRRAVRHGHRLGIERPFLHEIALCVVDMMGDTYPELKERRELIKRVTEDEEVRFRATLKRGMKILEDRFDDMRGQGESVLAAATAADLYTTYGFPLDLTEVICRESRFSVDAKEAEQLVRGASEVDGPIDPDAALDPAYRAMRADIEPVVFRGYDSEEGESEVVGLLTVRQEGDEGRTQTRRERVDRAAEGSEVEVVLRETPMYAESGGQVGDVGEIVTDGGTIQVSDTQRPMAGLVVHRGTVQKGEVAVGERARVVVDHAARSATRRNHSATHLLHWALRRVLGEHAAQKGSRVGPDVLRFDFAHGKVMTPEEIRQVEDLVNAKLLSNAPVTTEVLPIDEAKARGAVAIFEEKYGDVVRVLTMTQDSVELCGGTHARALGEIGMFKISSEGGVAAGVRRLFATTGENTMGAVRRVEDEVARIRQVVKSPGGNLAERIQKLVQREKELEKQVGELERKLLEGGGGSGGGIDEMLTAAREIGGVKVLAWRVADGTQGGALRELAEKLRDRLGEAAVLLGSVTSGKVQLVIMVSKATSGRLRAGDLIKVVAKHVGGSGGGRPDMAQAGGTDVSQIDAAIAAMSPAVESALAAS